MASLSQIVRHLNPFTHQERNVTMNTQTIHPTLPAVDIPLNQIEANGYNVRRTGAGKGIEELAASIKAHGLRQNLNVREVAEGYVVVAGHRRLAALKLLASRGDLAADAKISCLVVEQGENAIEIALAENAMREQMHPADQFDAFNRLAQEGMPVEDIGARFGVTPSVVKQRLKLAAVSPKLLDEYREDKMTLEQVMAFTLTDDHKKQETAWEAAKKSSYGGRVYPESIRQRLMEKSVGSDDPRVKFVTLQAYIDAGGPVTRDLFETHQCYLDDPALLDRLVEGKLAHQKEKLEKEGWAWVETHTGRVPYESGYGWLQGYGSSKSDIKAADRKKSGVRVGFDSDGKWDYEWGRTSPDQVKAERKEEKAAKVSRGEEPDTGEWTGPQLGEMGKIRTFALADAVLQHNPHFGLRLLAYTLTLDLYEGSLSFELGSALTIHTADHMNTRLEDLDLEHPDELASYATIRRDYDEWMKVLPKKPEDLWQWCLDADLSRINSLLLFLAARAIDAKSQRPHEGMGRHNHIEQLQQTFMAGNKMFPELWTPTAAGFLGRMSKKQLQQALIDAGKPDAAAALDKLKKDAAAAKAEAELKGTGWLPKPLRVSESKAEKKAGKSKKKGGK